MSYDPGMWWWLWLAVAVILLLAYLGWLDGRVGRLHRRAAAAAAALDATLVRRAAVAAVLADQLSGTAPQVATDLYALARASLDTGPEEREAAENDLTRALRRLPEPVRTSTRAWPNLVTASRRVGLARQVHTDVVRDALAVRRRIPVRLFGLARRHPAPAYFDVDDPGLDGHVQARDGGAGVANGPTGEATGR